jgi:quinol monooxygenase YgiN
MEQGPVRVVARIKALPDKTDAVRSILSELIEPTRKEAGCVTYELLQNKSDPTDFTFVEEWESDTALEAHAVSDHINDVTSKLQGLLADAPDIRRYLLLR